MDSPNLKLWRGTPRLPGPCRGRPRGCGSGRALAAIPPRPWSPPASAPVIESHRSNSRQKTFFDGGSELHAGGENSRQKITGWNSRPKLRLTAPLTHDTACHGSKPPWSGHHPGTKPARRSQQSTVQIGGREPAPGQSRSWSRRNPPAIALSGYEGFRIYNGFRVKVLGLRVHGLGLGGQGFRRVGDGGLTRWIAI